MSDEARPLDAVEAELTELCGHLTAGTARFLALVAEFDARQGWADQGAKDCAEWLAWRCSMAPVTAREQVRVAARLRDFSQVRAAFEAGELSYSKVRAISRVVTEATEHDLVDIARHATAADLEAMCRSYRAASVCEEETDDRYYMTCYQDHDGTWVLRGRLRAEDGALVRKPSTSAPTASTKRRAIPRNHRRGASAPARRLSRWPQPCSNGARPRALTETATS